MNSYEDKYRRDGQKIDTLRDLASEYRQIVFISFREKFHTHRYIHQQWTNFLSKIHIKNLWLENIKEANRHICPNSLVVFPDANKPGKCQIELRDDCSYIFHRGEWIDAPIPINARILNLYEHRNRFVEDAARFGPLEKLAPFVYASAKAKRLIQPWGVPLMEHEFLPPVTCRNTRKIFFIGTQWHANNEQLKRAKQQFADAGYDFIVRNNLNERDEIAHKRRSFTAMAVGTGGHREEAYLQCRIFKDISYGRLTITDVTPFKDILKNSFLPIKKYSDAVPIINSLPEAVEEGLCHLQQECIRSYTYLNMWINMLSCLKNFN